VDQTWARWALGVGAVVVFVLLLLAGRAFMAKLFTTGLRVVGRRAVFDPPAALASMTDEEVRSALDDIDDAAMRRVAEAEVMFDGLRSRVGADRVRAVDEQRRSDRRRLAAWSLEDHTAQGLPLHVEIDRAGPSVPDSLRMPMLQALSAGRVLDEERRGEFGVVLTEIHHANATWWVVTAEFGHSEVQYFAYPTATNAATRYDYLARRLRDDSSQF
jgi:hypothetical protein